MKITGREELFKGMLLGQDAIDLINNFFFSAYPKYAH